MRFAWALCFASNRASEMPARRSAQLRNVPRSPYDSCMPEAEVIAAFLQRRLHQLGLDEAPAVEAATWLDEAGLLRDSAGRPGLPLRKLLRAGTIPNGEQRPPFPNGRWFIVQERVGTLRDGSSRASGETLNPGPDSAAPTGVDDVDWARPVSTPTKQDGVREATVSNHDSRHLGTFTRAGLAARGFVGFERFKGIRLDHVPLQPGVYVVLREKDSRPVFLDRSPAGWFKGQDPTVPVAELEDAWPDSAHCVYLGKAGSGRSGARGLRQRIKEFRQYGNGRPVGHQGGRRVWQLADADDYVLAWRPTPGRDPEATEAELINGFMAEHGKRPIGNRTSGRSGARG